MPKSPVATSEDSQDSPFWGTQLAFKTTPTRQQGHHCQGSKQASTPETKLASITKLPPHLPGSQLVIRPISSPGSQLVVWPTFSLGSPSAGQQTTAPVLRRHSNPLYLSCRSPQLSLPCPCCQPEPYYDKELNRSTAAHQSPQITLKNFYSLI